jgi:dTDP-4-dehydrorhamnose reductase
MDNRETWLVTGASGFFGSNFPSAADSAELIALTRTGVIPAGYKSAVTADLNDPESITSAIEEVKPTYVLHAAALASHEECERNPDFAYALNANATRVIAETAHRVGSKLIYLSTDAVFNGETGNYLENDTPDPFSVYGKSKLEGEINATGVDPQSLVIRTNFFGWSPTHSRSILEFFVNKLEAQNPIGGYTDFTVTSIYVRYLAQHICQLRDQSGIWHVASRDALTKFDFGLNVAEVFGLNSALITPVTGKGEVSRARNISLNTDKFQNYLSEIGAMTPLSTQQEGITQAYKDRLVATDNV